MLLTALPMDQRVIVALVTAESAAGQASAALYDGDLSHSSARRTGQALCEWTIDSDCV
jgi:hypothetical protein